MDSGYPVESINHLLGIGTIGLQVATLILLYLFFFRRHSRLNAVIGRHSLLVGFLLSFASLFLSLFYSEVLGFAPCGLCWLQRICIYPQVIILGIAYLKNELRIADYSIGLSVIGFVIAIYHHWIQVGGNEFIPCAQSLLAADCAEKTLFEFGYITFPLMSASLLVLLIVLMAFAKRASRN